MPHMRGQYSHVTGGCAEPPSGRYRMAVANLTVATVESDVTAFIVENFLFGDASEAPARDASFMDTGLIDSTGILEVVAFLEEKYEIEVDDDELVPENFDSVGNIAGYVVKTQEEA